MGVDRLSCGGARRRCEEVRGEERGLREERGPAQVDCRGRGGGNADGDLVESRWRSGSTSRDANVKGLARGEARERERDEKAREGTGEARDDERETCTLRCTRENERDTWLQREREREPRTRARERERAHTRECVVAGCASYIEALE